MTRPSTARPDDRAVNAPARTARAALVSSYPPRASGVASFTDHLGRSLPDREIVALDQPGGRPAYSIEVHHRIRIDERAAFARTADALAACADVAAIQYAPAAWGGPDGEAVIDFARALRIPAVTTLHDLPVDPTPRRRELVAELVTESAACIVPSNSAKERLAAAYEVGTRAVEVIPLGVPDLPAVGPETARDAAAVLGVDGQAVILSFGLLEPEKGFELTIDALPEVLAANPSARYVIVGSTHPDERLHGGDRWRAELRRRADALGLGDRVRFVDQFVGRSELTRWLQVAAVVVMPHRDTERVSAGSLGYAMSAGRAIVSTPSPYAREALGDGAGVVLEGRSPGALAASINGLLADDAFRATLGARAHERSRAMVWARVGPAYQAVFDRVADPSTRMERRPNPARHAIRPAIR